MDKGRYVYADALEIESMLLELARHGIPQVKDAAYLDQIAAVIENMERIMVEVRSALHRA